MKCLILCRDKNTDWLFNYVRGDSPYMLKFAGKHLLEFYIELASFAGIKELRIVSETPDKRLEEYFSSGEKWGMDISYSMAKENDTLELILKKNSAFVADNHLFIISGFIFIHLSDNKNLPFMSSSESVCIETENGAVFKIVPGFTDIKNYKDSDLQLFSIRSLKDFYKISMELLTNKTSCYVLPGYNNEDGVFIGQNVEISRNTKINPPVVIADSVRLKELVSIGPNAIIGSNVLVDKAAIVKDSIIYDASYIGLDLEIKNKFVYRKKLADIETGEIIEVTDNFLISEFSDTAAVRKPFFMFHFLGALFLFLLMLPLYIVLRLLQLLTRDVKYTKKTFYADANTEKLLSINIPVRYKGWNIFNHIFFKCSIFKVPHFLKVFTGELNLVGNPPKENSESMKEEIQDMEFYFPSVFSYVEMLQTPETEDFENNINDLFYCSNVSFWFNVRIIIRSLLGNLFK